MYFWDYKSGYNFQRMDTIVQPGSLDSEMGVFASTFDKSGSRLITCEADKTIKIWREDDSAVCEFIFLLLLTAQKHIRRRKLIRSSSRVCCVALGGRKKKVFVKRKVY